MHALLVLGGNEIPFKVQATKADIVVCADSGADYALNQEIVPDVIIGDMDSVSSNTLDIYESKGVRIIKMPVEKDKTDGEISIDYIKEIGANSVEIVCAEGSVDHYLGNLYLLLYAKKISLDARLKTLDAIVYAVDDKITLSGEIGTRVSILPADGEIEVHSTSGLYYEIAEPLRITFGQTIGLGNHMVRDEFSINIGKGIAFVIIEKR